jgi:bifunctional DNA-binding transcriptional regulator/antitoxin component of YhaV-PrlF toxin-antitoxin module
MKTQWTLQIEEDPKTGDGILTFPTDLLEYTGWKEGDVIEWTDLQNGSWQLAKKQSFEVSTPEEDEAWQDLENTLKGKQNDKDQ